MHYIICVGVKDLEVKGLYYAGRGLWRKELVLAMKFYHKINAENVLARIKKEFDPNAFIMNRRI